MQAGGKRTARVLVRDDELQKQLQNNAGAASSRSTAKSFNLDFNKMYLYFFFNFECTDMSELKSNK